MRFDHVLVAVADFDAAVEHWTTEYGLGAVPGGRHGGWGTANWIVPLGNSYVELVGIDDELAATRSALGRRVGKALVAGGGLFAWCVAPADFDATADRLGLQGEPGERTKPNGEVVRWRTAGVDAGLADGSRPFFIRWDVAPQAHPGRSPANHATQPRGISWIEVTGDAENVRRWLGPEELRVQIRPGPPAIRAFAIATEAGEMVIRAAPSPGTAA